MLRRAVAVPLVLTALVIAACGDDPAISPREPSAPSTTPTSAEASGSSGLPARVPDALDFEAESVAGDAVDARAFAGRDVAMWFWAPW